MNNFKQASVYWNGGYIYTDTNGLKGKNLKVQKALIKAVATKQEFMVTDCMDELPIVYL